MAGLSDHQILFVDDDPVILSSFERVFHKHFFIVTCAEPLEALEVFKRRGPFSVVISDMHMPGIDGITLLTRMREINPDPVRIMLTGDSDVQIAVNAVNEGQIFRFLIKPCESQTMLRALVDAVRQYNLVQAEHELLEKTLKGSVKVLTEVLSMTNPLAFNKARRIAVYAVRIAEMLHLPDLWQYEIAALLSQLGCITLPPETVDKYFSGLELTDPEKAMLRDYPQVGYDLLRNIPRMEKIAAMIRLQQQLASRERYRKPVKEIEPELFGGLLLKSCLEFELLLSTIPNPEAVMPRMKESSAALIPELLECFARLHPEHYSVEDFKLIKIADLADGMLLIEAITARNGLLIVGKDCIINSAIRQRLANFQRHGLIGETAKVAIPH